MVGQQTKGQAPDGRAAVVSRPATQNKPHSAKPYRLTVQLRITHSREDEDAGSTGCGTQLEEMIEATFPA